MVPAKHVVSIWVSNSVPPWGYVRNYRKDDLLK